MERLLPLYALCGHSAYQTNCKQQTPACTIKASVEKNKVKPKHSQQQRKISLSASKKAVPRALPESPLNNKTRFQHSMVFAIAAYLGLAQTAELVTHQHYPTTQFSPLQAAYDLSLQNAPGLLEQTADISANMLSEMPSLTVRLQNPVPASNPLYMKLQPEFELKTSMVDALAETVAETATESITESTAIASIATAETTTELSATPEQTDETLSQAIPEPNLQPKLPSIVQAESPAQYSVPDQFYEADPQPVDIQIAQKQAPPPGSRPEEFLTDATAAVEVTDKPVLADASDTKPIPVNDAVTDYAIEADTKIIVPADINESSTEKSATADAAVNPKSDIAAINADNSRQESVEDLVSTDLIGSKSFVSTLPESDTPDHDLDYYRIALDESFLGSETNPHISGLNPAPPLVFHPSETNQVDAADSDPDVDSIHNPESINVYTESLPGLVAYDIIHPVVVIVDPGHGGVDPGTIGKYGMQEQELTLDMAKRLQTLATLHKDIEVVLTRNNSDGLSRLERIGKVASAKADLLLSLHFNHLPEGDITLVETYYTDTTDDLQASAVQHQAPADLHTLPARNLQQQDSNPVANAAVSRSFARHLQASVFGAVQNRNPLAIDAGVKRQSLYLLAQSGLPGALVEITCLSNPQEESRLRTEKYRNELANSLMQSLRKFVNSEDVAKSI